MTHEIGRGPVREIDWLGRLDAYRGSDPDDLPLIWTPEHVMVRLVDAYEVLARAPARIYPKAYGNAWPAILLNDIERRDLERVEDREAALRRQLARPSAHDLSRMSEALAWPMEHLAGFPLMADAVTLYAFAKAKGLELAPILHRRKIASADNRCRTRKALDKWRKRGAEIIAAGLNHLDIPVR
jgi:hypothetical protein